MNGPDFDLEQLTSNVAALRYRQRVFTRNYLGEDKDGEPIYETDADFRARILSESAKWGPADAREMRRPDFEYRAREQPPKPMSRRDLEGLGGAFLVSAGILSPFVLLYWRLPVFAVIQTTLLLVIGFRKLQRALWPCLVSGHAWHVIINSPVKTCDRCGKVGYV